jgi:hypothetical protein
VQTADGEEGEVEEAKRPGRRYTHKQGRVIKEQIERSDRIGRYIGGVANQQGTAYITNLVNTEM